MDENSSPAASDPVSTVEEAASRPWGPAPGAADSPATPKPRPVRRTTAMVLTLETQDRDPYPITVRPGERVLLGRDPRVALHTDFLGLFDTISRRHASLGLDEDGSAWLQDEYATNTIRVDFADVLPGTRVTLRDGASIQLCASVSGRLHFEEGTSHVRPQRS
jgi:hypothetical protein